MQLLKDTLMRFRWPLMELPNVVGVGIGSKLTAGQDTGNQALVVFVTEKVPEEHLHPEFRIPKTLDSLATDVVKVGEIRFFDEQNDRLRPAVPGISIGHYRITAGTFGAVVYDGTTGEPLILSNNHVLANSTNGADNRAEPGDAILQPGAYDSGTVADDTIGFLHRFIPIRYTAEEAQCPIARGFEKTLNAFIQVFRPAYYVKVFKRLQATPNLVDCAVARPIAADAVNPEILGIGAVQGTVAPQLYMNVKKSGRTTGLTTGQILYLNATLNVRLDQTRSALFEEQIMCGPMSAPGDSGSLVLNEDNRAVGLLFAGSEEITVINDISNVTQALNVRLTN